MRSAIGSKVLTATLAGVLTLGGLSAAAWAQRDPAYAAARAAGQIGEMMDGYIGIVGAETPELRRIVNAINIKRREVYSIKAPAANPPATLQEYAFATGCVAIAATEPGEKYQAPDKTWKTRTTAPPELHPDCSRSPSQ
jgi:uncharacterized protein YdbL (DUF1318 family)